MIKKTLSKTLKILLLLLCIAAAVGAFWLITGNSAKGDSVAGFEYYHYDISKFDEKCEELESAVKADDADAVIKLYDELYAECEEVETLYAAAYVLYSTDMDDEYYSDEQEYSYTTLEKCEDKLCTICHDIALSSSADAFKEHVGEDAFAGFKDYEPYTDRDWELIEKEQKLVDEYYDLYTDPDLTCEYNGTVWDLDMLDGSEGDELYETDTDGYYIVADEIEKKFNEKGGPIFKELVDLRNEFAQLHGYDNYAVYADEVEYTRDYSDADITLLHKSVKKNSKAFIPLYYDFYMSTGEDLPVMSNKELLDILCTYSDETGSVAGQAAAMLKDDNLYSIDDGKSRQPGGYTIYLPKVEKPFIFITNDDAENTLPTLTHEFGHFTEDINDSRSNALTDSDNIDLAEIASNGFECLMTHYYDEIFDDQADQARKEIITELMENVIYGCIEDEFQRAVYKNPDMTLEEMNNLYGKINAEYGIGSGGRDYSWVFVTHTFEQPMYYISYAVSGLAALQIWSQSNTDFDGAVKTWESFLEEGIYNKTYLDVVGRCGLIKFNKQGAVDEICKPALDAFR